MATSAPARNQVLTGAALFAYIVTKARSIGLDPALALSTVPHEGKLQGVTGDNGTSFGPWQLHEGGALPAGKSGAWANTPEGIDYALGQIKGVVGNESGASAVYTLVADFEKPAGTKDGHIEPGTIADAEYHNSLATYATLRTAESQTILSPLAANNPGPQLASFWGNVKGVFGGMVAGGSAAGGAAGVTPIPVPGIDSLPGINAGAIGNALLPDWFSFKNIERGGEFVVGFVLALLGLYLLARSEVPGTPSPGQVAAVAAL